MSWVGLRMQKFIEDFETGFLSLFAKRSVLDFKSKNLLSLFRSTISTCKTLFRTVCRLIWNIFFIAKRIEFHEICNQECTFFFLGLTPWNSFKSHSKFYEHNNVNWMLSQSNELKTFFIQSYSFQLSSWIQLVIILLVKIRTTSNIALR